MRSFLPLLLPALSLAQGVGIDFLTAGLPAATVNRPYTPGPFVAVGGGRCTSNLMGFRVVSGRLPEGVTLSAAGFLRGIPATEGIYSFTVRAQNECVSYWKTFLLSVDGPPVLSIVPARIDFRYQPGAPVPEPQTLRVSATAAGLAYAVEADGASWLELRPLRGRTPERGSALQDDIVELRVDPGKLSPGDYTVRVRAQAWEAANAPYTVVTLRVSGRQWE